MPGYVLSIKMDYIVFLKSQKMNLARLKSIPGKTEAKTSKTKEKKEM